MYLPDDLKNYAAPDAFQLIAEDVAALLCFGGCIILLLLWPTY